MTDSAHSHHHPVPGFHGPRCWVLSAVAGAILGVLLSFILPAAQAEHHPAAMEAATATRVIERLPTGETFERFFDRPPVQLPADGVLPPPPAASPTLPPPDPTPVIIQGPHAAAGEHEAATADHGPGPGHAPPPPIPLILLVPFAAMLLSIALMPFINERFWLVHFPDFAFFLGSLMLAYYVTAFGEYGREQMLHVALEYYAFIALVGGLYVASGGILIDVRGRATPVVNTTLLACGAVLANIVGTTGASVLLIRPFMRLNRGRLKPIHIILFIFIVSNCGGCLTPIGDPPLYLGFLRGVPFFWTTTHLWPMWLMAISLLLAIFFVIDSQIGRGRGGGGGGGGGSRSAGHEVLVPSPLEQLLELPSRSGAQRGPGVSISGTSAMIALGLIVAGVFIDPLLGPKLGLEGIPVGPTFQIIVAAVAFRLAPREIHRANIFSFHPVREVGILFIGIFLTMAPALAYLQANGARIGLQTPAQYYYSTGTLSAFLDNAPTYLNFLQASFGMLHLPLNAEGVARFVSATYLIMYPDGSSAQIHGAHILAAISLGAVFFGAMTYIGNGPNFMVKAIAESSGLRMPSFLGYTLYAMVLLLPVLVLVWAVFLVT